MDLDAGVAHGVSGRPSKLLISEISDAILTTFEYAETRGSRELLWCGLGVGSPFITGPVLYNALRRSATTVNPQAPLEFHRTLPGYEQTALRELPGLARELGVARVFAKDESSRLGLPSFKVVGASWAVKVAVLERLGTATRDATLDELREIVRGRTLRLTTATDGNHGRAVAHVARLLQLPCHVFVPATVSAARVAAIEQEGAEVTVLDCSYDETVVHSARDAESDPDVLLVSDTSWPGYERIPAAVVEGYSTILNETSRQLRELGADPPQLTAVQMGVGSFAASVVSYLRAPDMPTGLRLAGVEPTKAACVLGSLAAGRRLSIPAPFDSMMSGLNCGTPSLIAWPLVACGLDVALAVDDDAAREGMRDLANEGVVGGPCAGTSVAGVRELLAGADADYHRDKLGVTDDATVLLFVTEGATDPRAYESAVGRSAAAVLNGA